MYTRLFAVCRALAALVVAIWLTAGYAPRPAAVQAQDETYGDLTVTAIVAQKFTYQGVLKQDGVPVNGTRDLTFRLFRNDACTNQAGGDIVRPGVPFQDGMFTVDLAVNNTQVNGQALWLQMEVGGEPIGCQEIVPVPYALSLRPGAYVNAPDTSGYALHLQNGTVMTSGDPPKSALMASTNDGIGVFAYSMAGTGIRAMGFPAGSFVGDVEQGIEHNGLVKAGVVAFCNNANSEIDRSFNGVVDTPIMIANGSGSGRCTIDFGFDISDRYIIASAAPPTAGLDRAVTVHYGTGTSAEFLVFRIVDGAPFGGSITVIVY